MQLLEEVMLRQTGDTEARRDEQQWGGAASPGAGRRKDSDGIRTWSQDHPMGTGTLQGEQHLWRYSLKQIEHWGEIPQISQRSTLQFSTSTSHWLTIPKGQSINHSGMDGY